MPPERKEGAERRRGGGPAGPQARRRKNQLDLIQCFPQRAVGAELDGELVVVLRPRFMRGPLARWLQPRLKRPYFRVHLDTLGSFVWNHCDGETSVAEIAEAMARELSVKDQVVQRVVFFVRELERGKMIRVLERPVGPPPEEC
jgi:hypothetical protein